MLNKNNNPIQGHIFYHIQKSTFECIIYVGVSSVEGKGNMIEKWIPAKHNDLHPWKSMEIQA